MPLSDVMSQPKATAFLARVLAGSRVPHAFLFAGPPGVGKATLAQRFAQALLCHAPVRVSVQDPLSGQAISHRDACGHCDSCRLAQAGTHPDLHAVHRRLNVHSSDPAVRKGKGTELSVAVIREFLIEPTGRKASLTSAAGRDDGCGAGLKAFVVHEAERMSTEAQNALLKTLEQPPPRCVLLLLSSSVSRLLPTTRSRCQLALLGPLPLAFITQRLRQAGVPEDQAATLARLSAGSLGGALTLANTRWLDVKRRWLTGVSRLGSPADPHKLGVGELVKQLEDATEVATAARGDADEASPTEQARDGCRLLLSLTAQLLRDGLWLSAGADPAGLLHADQADLAEQARRRWQRPQLMERITLCSVAERRLASNVDPALTLEVLLAQLAA